WLLFLLNILIIGISFFLFIKMKIFSPTFPFVCPVIFWILFCSMFTLKFPDKKRDLSDAFKESVFASIFGGLLVLLLEFFEIRGNLHLLIPNFGNILQNLIGGLCLLPSF